MGLEQAVQSIRKVVMSSVDIFSRPVYSLAVFASEKRIYSFSRFFSQCYLCIPDVSKSNLPNWEVSNRSNRVGLSIDP